MRRVSLTSLIRLPVGKEEARRACCYQVIAENIHNMKIKFSVASSDITVTVITSRCLGVLV